MRVGRMLAVLVLIAAACGGDGDAGPDSTSTTPSTATSAPPRSTEPTIPPATTTPATTTPATTAPVTTAPVPSTSATVPPDGSGLPERWWRYGAGGLHLVRADGEQLLVDQPIGWASSDGAGGVLFTGWDPDRFGPTWWLGAGATDPVLVSEWDDPLIAARFGGRPALVGSLPTTEECPEDGQVHMVALVPATGERTTMQCFVGGQDAGSEADSFGGGMYVGVEWNAVHVSGRSTAIRLVFRDTAGDVIDLASNPFAGDCSPCELSAALAPDGSRLAVIQRPDARPFRGDGYDEWLASTLSIDGELRVFDLATGETLFARSLPAGSHPSAGSWFDGRYVVIGPDVFTFPWLTPGDRGDAVRTLQRLLVERGAAIEIDGIFGPATQVAVEAFHADHFGRNRSTIGPDSWAELGVPTTIIDTETGTTSDLPGRIALEVTLTDGPPPGVVLRTAENSGPP